MVNIENVSNYGFIVKYLFADESLCLSSENNKKDKMMTSEEVDLR